MTQDEIIEQPTPNQSEPEIKKAYNREYDAYYDSETLEWIDQKCTGENCEFCADRPAKCTPQPTSQQVDATTIAQLQANLAKLRECLERYCGDKCNSEYNPCEARKTLDALSTTSQEVLGETK